MKTYLIRGVPKAVQQDGWWLNAPPPARRGPQDGAAGAHMPHLAALAALLALGDALVWQVMPGLSLAVFGAALVLAAMCMTGPRLTPQRQGQVLASTVLVLCPLIELVQPLSVLIAAVGLSGVLCILAGVTPEGLSRAMLRLWPRGMEQTAQDARHALGGRRRLDLGARVQEAIMRWLMPVLLGLVFVTLLLAANPVAERWLAELELGTAGLPAPDRALFWLCLLPLCWTVLRLSALRERLTAAGRARKMGPPALGLVNPASTLRALVLFNAVFALQTGMDLVFLYGGFGLPEGISYAQYAHRGAYPLVVTGLLAGGFALLCRRWVQQDPALRLLLMAFVAQNLALVLSSLVRLEMYVDVYGLTRLRMAAAIWMALTAVGLGLILWQVYHHRDNGWLMRRGGALTAAVLYFSAFISFDATIARYNLTHDVAQDFYYLCQLGDAAKPVIARRAPAACTPSQLRIDRPRDWREWGFRNWRARTSLAWTGQGAAR